MRLVHVTLAGLVDSCGSPAKPTYPDLTAPQTPRFASAALASLVGSIGRAASANLPNHLRLASSTHRL